MFRVARTLAPGIASGTWTSYPAEAAGLRSIDTARRKEEPAQPPGAAYPCLQTPLLDPGATTLDQNDQHNHSQHARYNLDDQCIVHVESPFFLVVEKRFE
jgi:hypothetical protein